MDCERMTHCREFDSGIEMCGSQTIQSTAVKNSFRVADKRGAIGAATDSH